MDVICFFFHVPYLQLLPFLGAIPQSWSINLYLPRPGTCLTFRYRRLDWHFYKASTFVTLSSIEFLCSSHTPVSRTGKSDTSQGRIPGQTSAGIRILNSLSSQFSLISSTTSCAYSSICVPLCCGFESPEDAFFPLVFVVERVRTLLDEIRLVSVDGLWEC